MTPYVSSVFLFFIFYIFFLDYKGYSASNPALSCADVLENRP